MLANLAATMNLYISILTYIALISVVGCSSGLDKNERTRREISHEDERAAASFSQKNVRTNFRLPQMIDFEQFRATFHKSYDSALEEMLRLKLFLGRSYSVIVSAVAYRYRRSSFYRAVNDRFDWTPAELARSRNRLLAGGDELAAAATSDRDNGADLKPAELEAEPARIGAGANESSRAKLVRRRRRRRRRSVSDTSGEVGAAASVDSMPVSGAVQRRQSDEGCPHEPEIKPRHSRWDRNYALEDNYRHVCIVAADEGETRSYDHLPVKGNQRSQGLLTIVSRMFMGEGKKSAQDVRLERELAARRWDSDVVWVDHRESGCFHPVHHQRFCGSCYAFAGISFMEWAHCNATGQLLRFSEQYLLDCGPMTSDLLQACNGGRMDEVGGFFENFGLEAAATYPYKASKGICPYHPRADIESMGHLRVNMFSSLTVGVNQMEHYLARAPIIVALCGTDDFDFYGGGVYDGSQCKRRGDHAVLLVGHGREDDEEYWLVRNSFGRTWGEDGYMKLNKNSDCIHPREGTIYGSRDGLQVRIGLRRNERVPLPVNKAKTYVPAPIGLGGARVG